MEARKSFKSMMNQSGENLIFFPYYFPPIPCESSTAWDTWIEKQNKKNKKEILSLLVFVISLFSQPWSSLSVTQLNSLENVVYALCC